MLSRLLKLEANLPALDLCLVSWTARVLDNSHKWLSQPAFAVQKVTNVEWLKPKASIQEHRCSFHSNSLNRSLVPGVHRLQLAPSNMASSDSTVTNKSWYLNEYPKGLPQESQFELRESQISTKLEDGSDDVLVKVLYLSLDPYMRGRMKAGGSGYAQGFDLDKVRDTSYE